MPMAGPVDPPEIFVEKAAAAGIDGGHLFSLPPATFRPDPERTQNWKFRLEHVMEYTAKAPGFLPFFWLDPTESDADQQIEHTVSVGIRGFKIIPNHFRVRDVLEVLKRIAVLKIPVLFHSGILFDHYESGHFTRPLAFECLIRVPGLTFALAHIGWPWCDEYIAVYGKLRAAQNNVLHDLGLRMFAELTPGTPAVYRKEVLRKLYLAGFNPGCRVLWGSDCRANNYNTAAVKTKLARDKRIMSEIAEEWKTNPDYTEMSCQYRLDDIFGLATEKNFTEFHRNEFPRCDRNEAEQDEI